MRIYWLVTSYDPLIMYMFKDGLVRFSTEKFSLKTKNLKKRYIHLTNYSVNKKAEKYIKNSNTDPTNSAPWDDSQILSKWSHQQLKQYINDMGNDWKKVESDIKDVLIKTIISVEPHIVHQQNISTRYKNWWFELYGFDILLDHKLKPWLIEVNTNPSLSSSSPFDKNIKTRLIWDTLTLVGIKAYDKHKFKQEQEKLASIRRTNGLSKMNKASMAQLGDSKMQTQYGWFMNDNEVLDQFIEQETRLGGFERIFPHDYNVNYYSQFFETERVNNEIIKSYICGH